jgi:hypothetical protein
MLSTVANTAFSSTTDRGATVRVSASADAARNTAATAKLNAINLRIDRSTILSRRPRCGVC